MSDTRHVPDALTVRRYRGYSQKQSLELKPLTLLFGWNNSGKSALLRALPLLANSIEARGGQPLDLGGPSGRGAQFDDLRWRGEKHPGPSEPREVAMGLGLEWSDGTALEVGFHWPDRRSVSIAAIKIGKRWWRERLDRALDDRSALLQLEDSADPARKLSLHASGLSLTPTEEAPASIHAITDRWNTFGGQIQWLSSTRSPRWRTHPYAELRGHDRLSSDGGDVIGWLVEHPQLAAEISRTWYEQHLASRLLINEISPTGFECRLAHISDVRLANNLLDTGEGNIQVLPVLAALAAAEKRVGPPILALEEPESHLHPNLQEKLAARLVEVAQSSSDVRVIVETHSEHLLLAVQAQILNGLDPDLVALYWVEQLADGRSTAERVHIMADGTFGDSWPPGVFDSVLNMSRRVMGLQIQRSRGGAADR